MAERRTPSRTTTFALREYTQPLWKRAGFWQVVVAALALAPLLIAAYIRWSPMAPVAADVRPGPADPMPELHALLRAAPDAEQLASISRYNLFAPDRADWALAVAEAEAQTPDDASLKAAQEALDKVTFVGVFRARDQWRAMFDFPGRTPEQDLAVIGVGDEFQTWTVTAISGDTATFEFRGTERTLELRPKVAAAKPEAVRRGRADVSAKPADAKREMFYEPPISLDEARRQLREATKDDPPEVIQRLEDLLRSLEDDA